VFYIRNKELGKEDSTLVYRVPYHLFRDLGKDFFYDLHSAIVLNSVEDPDPEALMPI